MPKIVEYIPRHHELGHTFGGRTPVMRVAPGSVLRVATEDRFGGLVRGVDDHPSQVCQVPQLNPVSGPFYVAGAEPGDTLALHLVSITPARDHGFAGTCSHGGASVPAHTARTRDIPQATPASPPTMEERVWRYDIDMAAGTVRYAARRCDHVVDLPLAPTLGTVGVAPAAGEVRLSLAADAHGGSLDTPELKAGATLYLPVFVDGALFALGGGHARHGHGELCGAGVEIPTHTVLVVELVKGTGIPGPRLESDTHLMSIGSAGCLEDAVRTSRNDLVRWTAELTGLDMLDAWQLVSQAADAPVGGAGVANHTALVAMATSYLPTDLAVFDGIHQRLRSIAAEL
jgi:amidase